MNLSGEKPEGSGIGDFQAGKGVLRQLLVGLSTISITMSISTVFTEVTHPVLLIILAYLSLIVIVWDVEHFILYF